MPQFWENDPIVARAPQQGGFVPMTGADPLLPGKVVRQQQEIQQGAAEVAKTPAELRLLNAQASETEAKARKAASELSTAIDPAIAQRIGDLQLDDMLHAVEQAAALINGGGATGYTGAIKRTFGVGTDANDLSGALTTLKSNVMLDKLKELKNASATGASGMGALSEREGQMLASVIGSFDLKQSDPKLLDSLARIRQHALALKAIQAGKNPDDPAVQKAFGIGNPNVDATPPGGGTPGADKSSGLIGGPQDGGGPSQMGLAQGSTMSADDPALLGMRKHVSEMVRRGATQADIDQYAQSVGYPDKLDASAAIDFRTKHPEYQGGYSVAVQPRSVPMTLPRMLLNQAAQGPVGAYALGAGDMVSGGTLDNLTDNPALARAGMAGVAAQQPLPTLAGQITGGGLMGAGVEAGAARLGASGLGAMLAGDALPGMAYGAGSADDGNRLAGAGIGGLAGVIGGTAGRGIGRLVSGAADPAVQYLADRGVRLTPGQMFGGAGKRLEDAATSIPLVGGIIRNQRRRGVEDFNRAAFSEALAPIQAVAGNEIGENAVDQAQRAVGGAYDNALNGQRVSIDPQFGTDLSAAITGAGAIPRVGGEVVDSLGQIVPPHFDPAGNLTGENMQPLLRELRQFRSGYRNDPMGNRVNASVQDAENAITGMFDRQAPDVMPQFRAANEAYGNLATLEQAVLAAGNTGGRFMPSQLGRVARQGARRFQGRGAAARGDVPFFELQRAGQDVLPSSLPDSGTASRLLLPGALGLGGAGVGGARGGYENGVSGAEEGGGTGALTGLGIGAALASPYALRPILQRVMAANRPQAVRVLGDYLGATRLPGALALPLLAGGQ